MTNEILTQFKIVGKTIDEKGREITVWECLKCKMRTTDRENHKCEVENENI
jgi:hypothetical protein